MVHIFELGPVGAIIAVCNHILEHAKHLPTGEYNDNCIFNLTDAIECLADRALSGRSWPSDRGLPRLAART